jgi:photosystem II stability/assembly factor-like uncharacterized protein
MVMKNQFPKCVAMRWNKAVNRTMAVWLLLVGLHTWVLGQDRLTTDATPASWQNDAELTDVFFVDPLIGWAVGAQGTILRTVNGGQDWQSLGQPAVEEASSEMGLREKIRAMQQGTRTQHTGVADGSAEQLDPYRCRFESVFFIDAKNGWVAGGYQVPHMNHSRGILLRTNDGGLSWRRVQSTLIPRIRRIHFSDQAHGWAAGDRGNLFPGSIFYTADGGETWSNQALQRERAAPSDFMDADATEQGFVALDDRGQPLILRNGQLEPAAFEGQAAPRLNRLRMLDRLTGWAVGDEGALLRTQNGGLSWAPLVDQNHSALAEQLKQFDWLAIATSPSKIWLAGNPGSRLISIDRKSGEILSHSTGISAPIRSLYFADDQHGWLVGTLGTILATTDGGRSWHRQRGQHPNVAILGLAYDIQDLPLEELALYANEDEWLMAVATCHGAETDAGRQAVERLGGIGLFSLATGKQVEFSLEAQEQQIRKLVKLIRTLRPAIIICSSEYRKQTGTTPHHNTAFDPYLIVSTAVKAAGSRDAFPEQLEVAMLQPWNVDRVAYRAPAGDLIIDPKKMLLRTGCLCADRTSISRSLLNLSLSPTEKRVYRIDSTNANSRAASDLFSGMGNGYTAGSIPHRVRDTRLRTSRALLELSNRKPEKMADLVRFTANNETDLIIWNQKLQDWLAPVDEMLAGIWLSQLAEQYLTNGQIELAAKSLEYLVSRFHGHPLRAASLVWLTQYYSSDEFARLEMNNLSTFRSAIGQTELRAFNGARIGRSSSQTHRSYQDGQTITVWTPVADKLSLPNRHNAQETNASDAARSEPESTKPKIVPAKSAEPGAAPNTDFQTGQVQSFLQSRWRRASSYFSQLKQEDPDLSNEPSLRYLEASLKRKLSGTSTAESLYKQLARANGEDQELGAAATMELFLAGSGSTIPQMEAIRCLFVQGQPRLDGQLDDTVWQAVLQNQSEVRRIAVPGSASGTPRNRGWSDAIQTASADEVMFAHNGQYLFIGIRCQKLPGQFYQLSPDARPRDPDLSRRDRVEIQFDVDRDYQSTFKFTVDYRGWGAEELNGARGWNPKWFIARSEGETFWTVEIAIPKDALISSSTETVSSQGGSQLPAQTSDTPVQTTGKNILLQDSVWAMRLARLTTDLNLWNSSGESLEKSELSKGLYQRIEMHPAKFQFFTFR